MSSDDRDALMDAVEPFAQQMLQKYRGFHPIGATMNHDGKISLAAALEGQENPTPQEIIDRLMAAFRNQASAGEIRACVVCYDGRVVRPGKTRMSDAICTYFEHESGGASRVFLPYSRGLLGRVKYEAWFACKEDCQVFVGGTRREPIGDP